MPLSVYADTRCSGRNVICLIDPAQNHKLVFDQKDKMVELYEFSADFEETQNLAGQAPVMTSEMRKRLLSMVLVLEERAVRQEMREELSEEELEQLKTLGYIGG